MTRVVKFASVFDHLPPDVTLYEVGPRDGLQNESRMVPTDDKVALIDALSETGLRAIEITSFVNPKWIPQLADGGEVSRRITRKPGRGVFGAGAQPPGAGRRAGGRDEGGRGLHVARPRRTTRRTSTRPSPQTLEAFRDTVPPALAAGLRVRAYVSTVYGCPYEGAVDPGKAVELCRALRELGCYQVSLGDTIGVANPRQVRDVLTRVLAEIPAPEVAVHFHDTRGTALANILVSVEMGITTVDAALGGLGGCPYAPGASGNVATEDVVYMLEGMGVRTGVDLERLVDCVAAGLDAGRPRDAVEVLPRRHRRPLAPARGAARDGGASDERCRRSGRSAPCDTVEAMTARRCDRAAGARRARERTAFVTLNRPEPRTRCRGRWCGADGRLEALAADVKHDGDAARRGAHRRRRQGLLRGRRPQGAPGDDAAARRARSSTSSTSWPTRSRRFRGR